ncbi:MAG TPA: Xaa-Pro peptidase family protein [Chloroflexota bacterium]|nr:Xaa-Pro peptidase family protein [Chloroflexota bacterium]
MTTAIAPTDILGRVARLRALLAERRLDAVLISQPESRYYLSGYRGHDLPPRDSAGYLLITGDRLLLLTDMRTTQQAEQEATSYEVVQYPAGQRAMETVADLAAKLGVKRLAFEAIHLPYQLVTDLRAALDPSIELVPQTDLVDTLRIIKDPSELRALQAAIDVLDDAFAHLARFIEPGITERRLAWELEAYLRTHGAEGVSFAPITVGGPQTAIPHAVPSDRPLRESEPIIMDIGARVDHYCSDMTRTVCIGPIPERLQEIRDIVLEAQLLAEREIRPGMTGREADAIARDFIASRGYGEAFGHGLGHGIGLEVHEPPWVSRAKGDVVLQPGMVFSVEPGIYLPGWGGVRIEDLVLLTADGCQVLCRSPKQLALDEVRRALAASEHPIQAPVEATS